MKLSSLLLQHESAIAARWLDQTLATYPADAAGFLQREQDQFANPVGQTIATGLQQLVHSLLREPLDPAALCQQLTYILRIRSVQEFAPSQAVSFVFLLKAAVREELAAELHASELQAELTQFDHRVDQLALFAFDIFTKSREQLYEVRVNEVKRRVSGLLRRVGVGFDDLEPEPDVLITQLLRQPSNGSVGR